METSRPVQQPASRKDCTKLCCRKGDSWSTHYQALDDYINGPTSDGLMDRGGWESLATSVRLQASGLRHLGLAHGMSLPPRRRSD